MHLLRADARSLDDAEAAVDLAQTPADFVFLSFSDSDLAMVASVAQRRDNGAMSLRLANLAQLKHPYSVDLYLEKVASKARFVLVRLLGGLDYWRYGVEELARAARAKDFALAVVPGDVMDDARLDEASTVPEASLRQITAAFRGGEPSSVAKLLRWIESYGRTPIDWTSDVPAPAPPAAGVFEPARRRPEGATGAALVVFYRSFLLAGDTEAVHALAEALCGRGLAVTPVYVTSLKDPEAIAFLRGEIARERPAVIINTTAFSARLDERPGVLEEAGSAVIQAIMAGCGADQWNADPRGLGAADLAMNIVLPEIDGRLISRAVAFKAPAERSADFEFTPARHVPAPSRIAFVAGLAAAWARLRELPAKAKRIACVLPDYPGKAGRGGYAVGLDTARSVLSIADLMRDAGYGIGPLPDEIELMKALEAGARTQRLSLSDYAAALGELPRSFAESVRAHWGEPEEDPQFSSGGFCLTILEAGNFFLALQPERGAKADRKAQYHDIALPPRHGYVAFYVWLRRIARIDALIFCGAHGTLEWLPGKAAALDAACAPEAVLGPVPVVYPFIVNNPGEAAQAKRRICAAAIGHLTPPLTRAGSHGAALEIEALFDEYAAAESLDPKRAGRLAETILERAAETGLSQDCGLREGADPVAALTRLDAWLCDLKDMRIRDGLHVFGQSPAAALRDATAASLMEALAPSADGGSSAGETEFAIGALVDRCGGAERESLLKALGGGFVQPGPGGAPSRGRLDVLPTGRNIYGVDPRAVPTRTAWEIGRRAAQEVLNRYAQDHGEWPERIVLDLWASATMRTGGEDLCQAFALLGVRPAWDLASSRVNGFEIVPLARLDRPRVDVTVRISGLFRDVFPMQIGLFDAAVRAIAGLDEDAADNPLAGLRRAGANAPLRIFGAAPSRYGIGLSREIDADASAARADLAELYLGATSHAYAGVKAEGIACDAFRERVASANAFVHVQDQDEQDILDSPTIADHVGGFSAAAQWLGNDAESYSVEAGRPGALKVRTTAEDIARVVRARAANPRWIAGQMRHGHRGAAEIAQTIDHLFAFAVLTDAVESRHFDLMFEATCGAPAVRDFLIEANPGAARAILERFEAARRRGFWRSLRNSSFETLASMREALPC
ncbi:cobaltochelatase subunit CobN [Methylocapsa palsarum]|uniref:Cobaltochelatase CobN n=1 Tax=Methylocapsa palsarum TaxID=1612308 RepID=A0A1I4BYY3_9HYPH|nr:cobaltochelatase subunit CobN [Methylocapsa palsarum]SFK73610.1 cobaltochelatase CobN [Methylocapsa palsarum]